MQSVPDDVLLSIIGFLEWETVAKTVSLIDKRFYSLSNRDVVWKNLIQNHYGKGATLKDHKDWKSMFAYLHPKRWNWIIQTDNSSGLMIDGPYAQESGVHWTYLEADVQLDSGTHYWEFKIEHINGLIIAKPKTFFVFGIQQYRSFNSDLSVSFVNLGFLFCKGKIMNKNQREDFSFGDTIGMLLEINEKHVSFFKNGEYFYTIDFDGLKTPLCPMVR
eukprot:TRINITY_DN6407_c0_g1_i2.p1 TRINITY_DN6407_c0_g1~~TRINITY_DN6407_c0_g1_i2.p1  ORF type:complete len:218 (-),score=43.18 TRINITY_DN6407_c0_g1_i2:173-826(-)